MMAIESFANGQHLAAGPLEFGIPTTPVSSAAVAAPAAATATAAARAVGWQTFAASALTAFAATVGGFVHFCGYRPGNEEVPETTGIYGANLTSNELLEVTSKLRG